MSQGQRLTQEEVEEYIAYHNEGVPVPEKYDNVVFDNAANGDSFYRYKTAEEEKAGKERAAREAKALEAAKTRREKIVADAQKRGLPVVPERPDMGARTVEGGTDSANRTSR